MMKILYGVVWYILLSFTGPAVSAHELDTSCEVRLTDTRQVPILFRWFRDELDKLSRPGRAMIVDTAKASALEMFGGVENIGEIGAEYTGGRSWIFLQNQFGRAFQAEVLFPPLLVWKRFTSGDGGSPMALPVISDVKDPVEFGTVITAGSRVRRFISFERLADETFKITIGLDVDCERVRFYTNAGVRRYILFVEGQYLCRVPVIVSAPRPN
jgi:hypothetical protein